jgi:hypothetical protein
MTRNIMIQKEYNCGISGPRRGGLIALQRAKGDNFRLAARTGLE